MMKGQVELPLIGLIGTFTILLAVILPPVIVKNTINNEVDFTYKFEKAQSTVLTLLSSTTDSGQSSYENVGLSTIQHKPVDDKLKNNLDKSVGADYCILIQQKDKQPETLASKNEVCASSNIKFNTVIVVPYNQEALTNKQSLIRIVGVDIK